MMNEEFYPDIDPELEDRLVALLLGEASDYDRDQLEELIRKQPELAAAKERFQEIHGLLCDVGAGELADREDDWKLPEWRRARVLAVLDGEEPNPDSQPMVSVASQSAKWNRFFLSRRFLASVSAACVLLLGGRFFATTFWYRPASRSSGIAWVEANAPQDALAEVELLKEREAGKATWKRGRPQLLDDPVADFGLQSGGDEGSKAALATLRDTLEWAEETPADNDPAEETPMDSYAVLPTPYYLYDDTQYFSNGRDRPTGDLPAGSVGLPQAGSAGLPQSGSVGLPEASSIRVPVPRVAGIRAPSKEMDFDAVVDSRRYSGGMSGAGDSSGGYAGSLGGGASSADEGRPQVALEGGSQAGFAVPELPALSETSSPAPSGLAYSGASNGKGLGVPAQDYEKGWLTLPQPVTDSAQPSDESTVVSDGDAILLGGIALRGETHENGSSVAMSATPRIIFQEEEEPYGVFGRLADSALAGEDSSGGAKPNSGGAKPNVDDIVALDRKALRGRPQLEAPFSRDARSQLGESDLEGFEGVWMDDSPSGAEQIAPRRRSARLGQAAEERFLLGELSGGRASERPATQANVERRSEVEESITQNSRKGTEESIKKKKVPKQIADGSMNFNGVLESREQGFVGERSDTSFDMEDKLGSGAKQSSARGKQRHLSWQFFQAAEDANRNSDAKSDEAIRRGGEQVGQSAKLSQSPVDEGIDGDASLEASIEPDTSSSFLQQHGRAIVPQAMAPSNHSGAEDEQAEAAGFAADDDADADGLVDADGLHGKDQASSWRYRAQLSLEKLSRLNSLGDVDVPADEELRYDAASRFESVAPEMAPSAAELDVEGVQENFSAAVPAFGGFDVAGTSIGKNDITLHDYAESKRGSLREFSRESKSVRERVAPLGLGEKSAGKDAYSTFSLHVSDVSFKLALAALSKGEWPDASRIRIEEFVNAFDYRDPLPVGDEKVACRLEQTIHPFVQQRNLLRISMRTAATGRAAGTPLRLTLLLDNSGSMERSDRRQTLRKAFELLIQQLQPEDQVTLISFASSPRLLADKTPAANAGQLVQLIENLPSEGGTNIEQALLLAFEKAKEQQLVDAQNRIVLLTDGAVNLGDANPESLSKVVTTIRDAGIAFDAAGMSAQDLNDDVLEALTRQGDGRYYLLDSVEDARDGFAQQIAGALRPSAKNVKVQIEFNPKRIGNYKLLGFEKHRLEKEDFRNDQVDAAEMAAAEAGVAVYQLEAKPDGEGDVGSVSVRFLDLATGRMVENRWPIPYEPNAQRADRANPSMQIATAASMLAAKLRGTPLGETVDFGTLAVLVANLPGEYQYERVQQLQAMIQAARQIAAP